MNPRRRHLLILLATVLLSVSLGGVATAVTPGSHAPASHAPASHAPASHKLRVTKQRCAKPAWRRHHPRLCRKFRRPTSSRHSSGPAYGPAPLAPAGGPAAPTSGSTGGTSPAPAPPVPPAESPAAGPPTVPHVQITAVEYSFTLSRSTVPAGKVIFEFVNNGQDEHNLNAASEEGELAVSFHTALSKEVSHLEVEVQPGTYTLFCSLPEHEAKGMKASLVVQ
jgi:plastocyanin